VTFYRVSLDQRGVTAGVHVRNTQPGPSCGIINFVDLGRKTVGFQMRNPVLAVTARRVFPDFDQRLLCSRKCELGEW
jgi:hypothetical protein